MQRWSSFPPGFKILLSIAIAVGLFFRFSNLDGKLYWHDEVYTSLRAAGYSGATIAEDLFQNRLFTPDDLLAYQRIKPDSTVIDSIESLAIEDPQHPPLYFLLARSWMHLFGSSRIASRALPALLSLVSLPAMYLLAVELFASPLVGGLAVMLLALSPFDILFAQVARQYSLLTLVTIVSSWLLLRALRRPNFGNWGVYAVGSALGLYVHPFFGLSLIAHGVYALITPERRRASAFWIYPKSLTQFLGAMGVTLLLFSPWLVVLVGNFDRVLETTSWAKYGGEWLYLLKLWVLSFTSLFFDLDFGVDNWGTYALRVPFLLLIVLGLDTVTRQTTKSTKWFIILSIFVPLLLLAVPDLIAGSRRSSITRYLIPCFPGVQLAVACFLANIAPSPRWFRSPSWWWRGCLAFILVGSVVSCSIRASLETWWHNIPSYFNADIARVVNTSPSPVVLSDRGYDGTQIGDLISLAYLFDSDVKLFLFDDSPAPQQIRNILTDSQFETHFAFRMSPATIDRLAAEGWDVFEDGGFPYGGLVAVKPETPSQQ
ncbi:MAG: glycosyltransferase family 39 protein [Cyanobacteria bacterium SID2]|nr:glycosyltransferase family 39 protein [Cyanobacteria bacterium SID2]MBP0003910.1 glycosyltransferase family 39 protein [Cyanobacteria bacterium SBC]